MVNLLKRSVLILPVLFLSGCLSWLPGMGGGTNVAANTQIGSQNNQAAVVGKIQGDTKVEATNLGKLTNAEQAIEAAQVSIQNLPPWAIILIILGWILPSPIEIWVGIKKAISDFFKSIGDGVKFIVGLFKGK